MKVCEQPGIYKFKAEPGNNQITMIFSGPMKKPSDIPDYMTHVKECVKQLKPGYKQLVYLTKNSTAPGLNLTGELKESQKICEEAGLGKSAVVVDPSLLLQKLSLKVVTKLSGLKEKVQIFSDEKKALAFLNQA